MNRGQLTLRVSRMLGVSRQDSDDETDETELLNELANEAVLDILTRTRVNVRKALITLDNGVSEFDLDPSVLRLYEITRGNNVLESQGENALDSSGYSFVGYSRISLGLPGVGDTVTAWYTPRPTPMTDDAHDPSSVTYGGVPAEHHRAILDYMCWHAADKVGDMQVARGQYRILYEGQDGLAGLESDLGKIKRAINTRGGGILTRRHREVLVSDRDAGYWQG